MTKKRVLSLLCLPFLAMQLMGADGPSKPATDPPSSSTSADASAASGSTTSTTADDLKKLREQIAKQQDEIKRLQQSVEAQQKALDKAVAAVEAAPAVRAAAPATITPVNTANNNAPVDIVPAVNRGWHLGGQQNSAAPGSPLGISIGDTTFTPLGFVDATFFWRSTNVGSGIGTNFLGIPYNNVPQGRLSEANFSDQNSRIGMRVDSTVLGAKVLGYLEADFLFNNDANSFQVTSNSAGLRLRNYFVDIQKDGFEVLGGQDWSLLTPNRVGLSPIPSDIFYSQNEDTNYQLGLTWTRQTQFRFISHPSEDFAIGVSLENPQQLLGGTNGSSTSALPANLNGTSTVVSQFQSNQSTYGVANLFPDIIAKAAYDGHAGDKREHIEVAGLVSGFQDEIPATLTTAIPGKHTAIGFGGSLNFNLELFKGFHLISNNFVSQGGGRYIFASAPDFVVRPSGQISPLHADSTVDGFELQVTPKTLLAMYYGGIYIGKDVVFDNTAAGSTLAKPVYVGYGYPGSTSYRDGQEITFDWNQTLWKNRNYGALNLINQYSYLMKEPWVIPTAGPKQAHSNMIYIDLRYTLP